MWLCSDSHVTIIFETITMKMLKSDETALSYNNFVKIMDTKTMYECCDECTFSLETKKSKLKKLLFIYLNCLYQCLILLLKKSPFVFYLQRFSHCGTDATLAPSSGAQHNSSSVSIRYTIFTLAYTYFLTPLVAPNVNSEVRT